MVERAVSEHNIDLQSSILVGDKITDIQCAINSGIPNYFKIKSKYTMPNEQIMLKEYANLSKVVEQVRKLWDIIAINGSMRWNWREIKKSGAKWFAKKIKKYAKDTVEKYTNFEEFSALLSLIILFGSRVV